MSYFHVPLQQILTNEILLQECRTNEAGVRLEACMTRHMPLAFVLAQETHAAGQFEHIQIENRRESRNPLTTDRI